jgi:hypothetical protein
MRAQAWGNPNVSTDPVLSVFFVLLGVYSKELVSQYGCGRWVHTQEHDGSARHQFAIPNIALRHAVGSKTPA